jgi:hypothetical protein
MVRVVLHNGDAAASGKSILFSFFSAYAVKLKAHKTRAKSIYHGLVLVLYIPLFPYIALDTAARPGVSCWAGCEKSIY